MKKDKERQARKHPQSAQEPEAEVTISKEEYSRLKQAASEKEQYLDRLVRQQAEFDNFRKRQERQRLEFIKYANEAIILELLGILDDLERFVSLAEKHKQDFKTFLKGVEMILAHLYELLKKQGVKAIEAVNKKFDPSYHEALMRADSDSEEDDKIIEELQRGYLLGDRVIRTAKVKVVKSKQREVEEIKEDEETKQDKAK